MMLLAPVVKNRKGEHVKLLDSLAAQGYIRARIDGEICDLSDPPELALQKKHTIEVVVDRFKVRSDLATRLAEIFWRQLWSFLGGRLWWLIWMILKRKSWFSRRILLARIVAIPCPN